MHEIFASQNRPIGASTIGEVLQRPDYEDEIVLNDSDPPDIDNIWTKKWQQCGSNRERDRTGCKRKSGPMDVGFSSYLSHIPGNIRTHPDMLTGIVALEKVAGSIPVGHPPICRINATVGAAW